MGKPIKGYRIGVCRNHFFERNQDAVKQAVEAAIYDLAAQGAQVIEFKIPNLEFGLAAIYAIELASSTAYHDRSLRAGRAAHFTPDVRTLVEMGRLISAPDYLKAEQLRTVLMEDFRRALDRVDVIVGPTTPITAWKVGEWNVQSGQQDRERAEPRPGASPFPTTSPACPRCPCPAGSTADGLPIGLQIAGRPFDEANVLRVAHAYERTHEWKDADA